VENMTLLNNTFTLFASVSPLSVDKVIVDWFNSFGMWGNTALVAVSLLMTFILSGIIGFEREYHGHAAGLRTHILVAMASCLVMIISVYGFDNLISPNRDPARLAAQVVSGIGFLGAGTIIQTGTDIKGLTTATTIFLTMSIGLACGAGRFVFATMATILSFFILVSLRKIEHYANRRSPKITIVVPSDVSVLKDAHLIAARYGVNIRDIQSQMVVINGFSCLRVTLNCAFASKATVTAFSEELKDRIKPLEFKISTDY
jgi:putative Mg2+ transporter-C (MgtC) family protein